MLLILFAVLYICGVHPFICLAIILICGTSLFIYVGRLSNKYGEYGLMKKMAKKIEMGLIITTAGIAAMRDIRAIKKSSL